MSLVPGLVSPPRVGFWSPPLSPPTLGGCAPHLCDMSRGICPMRPEILNDRGGSISRRRPDHQEGLQKPISTHRGGRDHQHQALQPQLCTSRWARELISSRRPSPNHQPQGGERAHQQQALQRQISNHRGARELISRRRSSAKSPTTGGREELNSSTGNELCTHTRGEGGATGPETYMSQVQGPRTPLLPRRV